MLLYYIIKSMEEYRKIEGYENYLVSNFGNVKNGKTGRILNPSLISKGYKGVNLYGKTYTVHKLVANAFIPNPDNKKCIDHIDNIKTNNNINNLRWVTNQENNFNRSISNRNTSGAKGISYDKKLNKWKAQIMFNRKTYHLGYFDNIEDAIDARKLKANNIFGNYTHQSERIINLNIAIPKNTTLNINVKVEEDEEYKRLEKEFEELIK